MPTRSSPCWRNRAWRRWTCGRALGRLRPGLDLPSFPQPHHHWTPEAGFLACQTIAETLRRDYGFTIPGKYTDERFFTRTFYSDYFLGSQGKRVGSLYAGVDDIELWVPTFHTNFTYSIPIYDMERTGPFEESLLFPERVEERDYFGGNPYTLYAGGDYPMGRIYNEVHPEGKRILLLRDSYACALTPFLALSCGELITIDLRYFHDDPALLRGLAGAGRGAGDVHRGQPGPGPPLRFLPRGRLLSGHLSKCAAHRPKTGTVR